MAYDPGAITGIPTENVGSLPRPMKLQEAYAAYDAGKIKIEQLEAEQEIAVRDSIKRFEATGSPIISDGEQRWSSFATYPLTDTLAGTGLADKLAGDGQYFAIFADGHKRQLPRLTGGPFKYKAYAADSLRKSIKLTTKPMKQAVIAPSMMCFYTLWIQNYRVIHWSNSRPIFATNVKRTSAMLSRRERPGYPSISPRGG